MPAQIPTWIAMYFVVAFSSSLDVAAIQMELGKPLNFNHELQTVGISNICSGLTGGFTGSYIFSQTIFTMRAGIRSRMIGAVVAMMGAVVRPLCFSVFMHQTALFHNPFEPWRGPCARTLPLTRSMPTFPHFWLI